MQLIDHFLLPEELSLDFGGFSVFCFGGGFKSMTAGDHFFPEMSLLDFIL